VVVGVLVGRGVGVGVGVAVGVGVGVGVFVGVLVGATDMGVGVGVAVGAGAALFPLSPSFVLSIFLISEGSFDVMPNSFLRRSAVCLDTYARDRISAISFGWDTNITIRGNVMRVKISGINIAGLIFFFVGLSGGGGGGTGMVGSGKAG
jgi:hypothetical protein